MTWAFELELEPNLKLVLLALADRSDDDGQSYYGQTTIAKKCSMGERTVRRHLATLEEMRLLTRTARMRPDGRGRTSDLYTLVKDQPANVATRSDDQPATDPRPTGQSTSDQPATVGQGYVRDTSDLIPRPSSVGCELCDYSGVRPNGDVCGCFLKAKAG